MERFCKLKELYRLIYEIENTVQSQYQITVNECLALCAINQGKTSAGQLVEALSQSKSRMSKILADLERKALVIRVSSPSDRRRSTFRLTPQGLAKLNEVEKTDFNIPQIDIKCQ